MKRDLYQRMVLLQSHQMVLELNYQLHVTEGVNIQPDFQYVVRPNAQSNLRDAPVLGLKAYVDF